jgi:hypothetical protein
VGKETRGQKPARAAFQVSVNCIGKLSREFDGRIRGWSRYEPRMGGRKARRMEESASTPIRGVAIQRLRVILRVF